MTQSTLSDLRAPFYQVEHDLLDRGLSPSAIAVYNVLARYAGRDRRCFPSIRSMAKSLGIGKTSVERALSDLQAKSVIRVTPRYDSCGDRTSNLYDLLPLSGGGCPATGTPVPSQVHGCPATGTELYPIEQDELKQGGIPRALRSARTTSGENAPRRKAPASVIHKERSEFLGFWKALYEKDRGVAYRVRPGEGNAVARIIRDCGSLGLAKEAATRMIQSTNRWVRDNTRIAILESQLNKFLVDEDPGTGRIQTRESPPDPERMRILDQLGS